jgi:putative ABC transport system permease protein
MTRRRAAAPDGSRVFSCLLRAYPRRFRARYGPEMLDLFSRRRREERERAGRRGVLRLWLRTAADVAATALAARSGELALALARRRLRRRAAGGRAPGSPTLARSSAGNGAAMSTLGQDLRYALRTLRQAPGFTAAAVLTLGLGIGANTAVFSVLDAVLLRPLPYPHPERLVTLWERERSGATENTSYANFLDWQSRCRSLQSLAVLSYWTPSVSGAGTPERFEGLRVSREFFRTLGVRPALGRDFLPEEDVRGKQHVVILGWGLWQRRFGGDPSLLGKPILLDGTPYTLVGVLPRGLESLFATNANRPPEIWGPLAYNPGLPFACRTCRHLRAVARLAPGISLERANRELDAVSRVLVAEHPRDYERAGVAVIPVAENLVGDYRPYLYLLMGAVALVLAIACGNVTNLLLARSQRRLGEMAVRTALGADRRRLVRQLLTESALLHLLGGVFGALLAAAGVTALVHASPPNVPRLSSVTVDARVLAVTFAVSMLTGIVFGLVPALRGSGQEMRAALAAAGAGAVGRRRSLAGLLVVGDLALALVLLIGAGLMLQSLYRLMAVDPGFDSRRLLAAEISASGPRYREDGKVLAFYQQALERVRALPGVEAAAVTSQLPLGGNFDSYGITLEDNPRAGEGDMPAAQRFAVSPDYLATMRIPLLAGRAFTAGDRAGSPAVVLVDRTFAQRVWPGCEPLGRRVRLGDPEGPWRTVVGVVGDVRHLGLDEPPAMQLYLPEAQWVDTDMVLAVRTRTEPRALAGAVRRAIWAVDRDRPITKLAAMDDIMQVSLARRLLILRLLAVFAGIAVLLAMVGIYGVLSQSVAARTREIGMRIALGASPRRIVSLVVRDGARQVAAGLALGAGLALALTRFLGSLLFGVTAQDPMTYACVALVLAAVAMAAAYLPARRAARLDPMTSTRAL